MFKFIVTRLPWMGDKIKAKLDMAGSEGARKAAEYVAERARYYVPVDTGRLKASITVIGTQGGMKWSVVATAPYARYVEYGSMHFGTFISPNPFMRRAFADGRKQFPILLKEAYVTALKGQSLGGTFKAA